MVGERCEDQIGSNNVMKTQHRANMNSKEDPLFISLGMFIIDDNEYPVSWNREPERNVVGGGGSYAIIGARIISGSKYGHRITGIIDKGKDFPQEVEEEINSLDTGIIFRYDETRNTTRGLNSYDENELRHFKYLTEKKRIEMGDLLENRQLLTCKCFHLICSVERCHQLVQEIRCFNPEAKFIYEPLPDDCIHSNYSKLLNLLPLVDIFSPNLNEGCRLLGKPEPGDIEGIKHIVEEYVSVGARNCVLRCGSLGCFVGSKSVSQYLPAYHRDQSKVVDVTGGGNSHCGGLMMGYYLSNDLVVGGICGNVASGCIIEKLGLAKRDGEKWNGKTATERLQEYARNERLQQYIDEIDWL